MTITISRNSFWEIFFEDEPTKRRYDPADELDILWRFPSQFGEGQSRSIKLRDGLGVVIRDCRLHDRLILKVSERQGNAVQCGCYLAGGMESWNIHLGDYETTGAGKHYFMGSGIRPSEIGAHLAQHHLLVEAWMSPELFTSFAGSLDGEIPLELQHLVRQPSQERYGRLGTTSQAMQKVAQKILHCPYWGMTKRFYLESKALELHCCWRKKPQSKLNSNLYISSAPTRLLAFIMLERFCCFSLITHHH